MNPTVRSPKQDYTPQKTTVWSQGPNFPQWRNQDLVLRGQFLQSDFAPISTTLPTVANRVHASPHTKWHLNPFSHLVHSTLSADGSTDKRTTLR